MERVRGLAAAVGALGLAVREPPPAVVAEDLRLVVCGERGLGDLRLRGLAPLFLVLGLDLVQQASSPVRSNGSCSGGPPRVCDQRVGGSALGSTAVRVTVWVTSVAAR